MTFVIGGMIQGGGGAGQQTYGPTYGAQAVRDGTALLAVTNPGGSPTVVNPGDDVAAKITTAGVGGTLWFTKGTYNITSALAPLQDQIWVLESAAGYTRTASDSVVMDGGNGALNALVMSSDSGVTIKGGLWQNQGSAASAAWATAILHNGGSTKGGWLVQDAIISTNYNRGLHFQGPNCVGRRVYSVSNGRYGVSCSKNGTDPRYSGIVFENCRVASNNTRHLDTGDDAGGSKFTNAAGLIIRNCWFHDNYGSGIWPDWEHYDTLIEENVVENNRNWGIFYEASFGGTSIRRNALYNNAEGETSPTMFNAVQILLSCCDATLGGSNSTVEVHNNIIDGTARQMMTIDHTSHPYDGKGAYFHDNDVWLRGAPSFARVGASSNEDMDIYGAPANNRFELNSYHVNATGGLQYNWNTTTAGTAHNFTDWQAHGHDDAGSEVVI